MIESKKEYGLNVLKKILTAFHEKRFGDVSMIVDESTMNESDLKEFVQGTVELNEFSTIDEYTEENIISIDDEDEEPFAIESYLSADNGNALPMCLRLEFECRADGTIKSFLEVEPD